MQKQDIPKLIYLYIHSKIYSLTNGSRLISIKRAKSYLQEWRIPKSLWALIIKEMEIMKLLQKADRTTFKVSVPLFREDQINDYYFSLGIIQDKD